MSLDSYHRIDYWKRYFDDERRTKLENKMKQLKNKKSEKDILIRKSLTSDERMIISLKKELYTYKKLLQEQEQINNNLLSELSDKRSENNYYRLQLNIIRKQLKDIK
tara:strand:+ start:87 stop:407 length:321 start_codon:yes stop_codon:yes gene_type:complete